MTPQKIKNAHKIIKEVYNHRGKITDAEVIENIAVIEKKGPHFTYDWRQRRIAAILNLWKNYKYDRTIY